MCKYYTILYKELEKPWILVFLDSSGTNPLKPLRDCCQYCGTEKCLVGQRQKAEFGKAETTRICEAGKLVITEHQKEEAKQRPSVRICTEVPLTDWLYTKFHARNMRLHRLSTDNQGAGHTTANGVLSRLELFPISTSQSKALFNPDTNRHGHAIESKAKVNL